MKNHIRPTFAKVTAFVALFIALSSVAYAGGIGRDTIKSKQIKAGAVKTDELAAGAVTKEKLAPGVLSAGATGAATHVARAAGNATLNALGAEITNADSVASITLPEGNWVVQAQATFGSNAAAERNISCVLLDANNPLSTANTHTRALAIFSASLSLVGVSDGGTVHLACATDPNGAQVRDRILVATQVGTVTG